MEKLDEKIAALERVQRMEQRENSEKGKEDDRLLLSVEEIRQGIRKESFLLPGKGELSFKTAVCFEEKIPLIFPDEFYTDRQETEDAIILVNNEKKVGQTLIHLQVDMEKLGMDAWEEQIKQGMKANGFYVDIIKKVQLGALDYIAYRIPSKDGWIYNIMCRIHKTDWRVIGGGNCMDEDRDTYGRMLEAVLMEMAQRL